ncbi:MAG: hypothetical protein ABR915_00015 [Thermoguttaceae bacterium]|jgi:hypothetical protein
MAMTAMMGGIFMGVVLLVSCWCPHRHKFHYAPFPTALEKAGLFGPRLLALVGWLKGVCHMSFTTIRKYLRDVVDVRVSRGYLAFSGLTVSPWSAPPAWTVNAYLFC